MNPVRIFHRRAVLVALILSCAASSALGQSSGARVKGDDRKAAGWVLSKGGNVTLLSRDKEVEVGAGQALPQDSFQIKRVFLQNTTAPKSTDPNDLAALVGPKLITAEELAVLAGLAKVENVFVQGVAAAPGFFDTLKTLPKLRDLHWLGDATMTDEHLKRFQELPPLEGIRFESNTTLTAAGLANLAATQPGLVSLNLKLGGYKDDAVPQLLKFRRLKTLDIAWTNVGLAATQSLAALPDLEFLSLSSGQLSAAMDWTKFGKLTQVRILFDEEIKISDSGLEGLATCRKLETLNVEGEADLTLVQMRAIGSLRSVRRLIFYSVTVPDGSWAHLAAMPKLETLKVVGVQPFTDRDLMGFADARSLKTLDLQGTLVTDAGVAAFRKKRGDVSVNVVK